MTQSLFSFLSNFVVLILATPLFPVTPTDSNSSSNSSLGKRKAEESSSIGAEVFARPTKISRTGLIADDDANPLLGSSKTEVEDPYAPFSLVRVYFGRLFLFLTI